MIRRTKKQAREAKNKAIKFRAKGYSYAEIAFKLGLNSHQLASYYIAKANKENKGN